MTALDDDRFRVRLRAPRGDSRTPRFVAKVLRQISASGTQVLEPRHAGAASTFGRGRVATAMTRRTMNPNARRVVIKSRFVVLKKAGLGAVTTHLRYIVRDGVTREGDTGHAYGPDGDAVDVHAFEVRGRGDRHQFRLIVSVEDAEQLEDLRDYTRTLMKQVSCDLETRLDWVAVDHWDTDNPHTHIVLRGRTVNGQDLVIAPSYMSHGMRGRASELATEWLGPRSNLEIRQGLRRETTQQRFTSLDRSLIRHASAGTFDLGRMTGDAPYRTMLRTRLQQLETMGLVRRLEDDHWQLSSRLEPTLTALGERGDILRAMHKALRGQVREYVLPDAGGEGGAVGRIAAKGFVDELSDRAYLVIDGINGCAHYVPLPVGTSLEKFPLSGIVELRSTSATRVPDQTVVSLAKEGFYRTDEHLALLRRQRDTTRDPNDVVEHHRRRLEALRRAGIVDRVGDGVWRVPEDLPERARQYDAQRRGLTKVELRSHLSVNRQVSALGATWLDRQLLNEGAGVGQSGFGGEVREAMQLRTDFLITEGLAVRRGDRLVLARNLLGVLQRREVFSVAKAIVAETRLTYRPPVDGKPSNGVYRRDVLLASGRFVMLDDGVGFSLVPWRPVLEKRMGLAMNAVVKGNTVSWQFGRQRGRSIV